LNVDLHRILEISLSEKTLPLESAIDSSARPNVCNEQNLRVNRENYPIVADTRSSLVGAGQGFREARVTWLCGDRVQLGYNPGLRGTIERGQVFAAVLLSSILSAKALSNLVYIDNLAQRSLTACPGENGGCFLGFLTRIEPIRQIQNSLSMLDKRTQTTGGEGIIGQSNAAHRLVRGVNRPRNHVESVDDSFDLLWRHWLRRSLDRNPAFHDSVHFIE
jgi:hypothetical protein